MADILETIIWSIIIFAPSGFICSILVKRFYIRNEYLRRAVSTILFFLIAYIIGIGFKYLLITLGAYPLVDTFL